MKKITVYVWVAEDLHLDASRRKLRKTVWYALRGTHKAHREARLGKKMIMNNNKVKLRDLEAVTRRQAKNSIWTQW